MDSLKGATLIKADGSKVEAEAALQNKVGDVMVVVSCTLKLQQELRHLDILFADE